MTCNGLRPSVAVCVGLIADDRKHRRQIFPLNLKRSQTSVPLIICEARKKVAHFKSDWTCFKANHKVSPIEHRSSQTRVSIKNCLSGKRRNGRESRPRFNYPDHPDHVPQIAADARTDVSLSATWRRLIGDRLADRS